MYYNGDQQITIGGISMSKSVLEPTVRVLFQSGAGTNITIYPEPDDRGERWAITFKVGGEDFGIASKREKVRTWASLNSAVHWLKRLGIKDASLKLVVE